MAAKMGMHLTLCHPEGFELDQDVRDSVQRSAELAGTGVRTVRDLAAGVEGADVVYAASWQAPNLHGRPAEEQELRDKHMDRRITSALLSRSNDARFLHAMPIRRNVEADDAVVDGPRSLVLAQAENRLHIQRALFKAVLAEAPRG
jgi:N-acetylornithine carbamoyltransferase